MHPITTERLLIRNFTTNDAYSLRKLILKFLESEYAVYDHPWPVSVEEIQQVVEYFASGDHFLAVDLKDGDTLIGFVALNPEEESETCDYNLGYNFDFDFQGHGYATEACTAVLRYAFEELNAECICTGTAAANEPSCRLLAKLGFKKTGEGIESFHEDKDGNPIEFLGYEYMLEKKEFKL